ncbi:MAG TPA: radical SAM protein [Bryobacteraceae bacterium]|nr:radical SAM protein [Bryobacteraceae bacterium]
MSAFDIFREDARTILSATGGFIAQAGFTHSLTPARNCTYRCSYCYVPTMRIQAGLKREDWEHWGRRTTFKQNAAELLAGRRPGVCERIYCSPLTDPWQPAEETEQLMPGVLRALLQRPPALIAFQTRSPLVLRDSELLLKLAAICTVRVSFSITTDDDDVRRLYEPLCNPIAERLRTVQSLASAGMDVYATLAPLLPCNPEELVRMACEVTSNDLIGDPLHVRAVKRSGATTREAARRIAAVQGHESWFDPAFQAQIVQRMENAARQRGRNFAIGPEGFGLLAR